MKVLRLAFKRDLCRPLCQWENPREVPGDRRAKARDSSEQFCLTPRTSRRSVHLPLDGWARLSLPKTVPLSPNLSHSNRFAPVSSSPKNAAMQTSCEIAVRHMICAKPTDLSSRGGLQMFSIYRLFKPVGAVRFLVGVAAMLVLAAPALAQTFAPGDGFCTYTQGGWGAVPQGNNPGTILHNNFSTVFGGFVEVGIPGIPGSAPYSMQF